MESFWSHYWPHLVLVTSGTVGVVAAIHAAMTKDDVRAAIGWVGVILLSPLIGAFLYLVAGINRIRQSAAGRRRASQDRHRRLGRPPIAIALSPSLSAMKRLGDRVAAFPLTSGNAVQMLDSGDAAYPAMLAAINGAKRHVALSSYIFDNDPVGVEFAGALIAAHQRGVAVRVLIDAIGARYSRPSIVGRLQAGGVVTDLFMGNLIGPRLPYANLRSHRKMLIVDGTLGFTGGMNIRAQFTSAHAGDDPARDTHFRVEGPAVEQLLTVFAQDWAFTTDEHLDGPAWAEGDHATPRGPVAVRVVPSGPDRNLACAHSVIMGALTMAQNRVRLCSPYFLPDQQLIGAFAVAGRRGVEVDVVIPSANNLKLVDYAMTAQLDQVLAGECQVWRAAGMFDHSKLMTVDGCWAYVGSSNLDPRSLRLNFELDLELYDPAIAGAIEARIGAMVAAGSRETLATLAARPFLKKLRNRAIWLASPYL
ncbi:PLDc N-terminal domain-containing protein [Ancylobacter dichloromethanicus]|uniref:Phospholipase D n=1 Tax=Ancylobacter dichloromethanicus TaxID=518825 RepID=A0A9W6N197_9HYPH|nr:phospholipase D-like domain-containing protein [Ancylobacter dichloromethanicus]MBS7552242.1 PLDc N-terminal domain-containing protein [Ancylobacter dichloromethanicus]GLK73978.1 cardiolipin synthetase [Ancylobacter dichloromethanicus]